MRMKEQCYQSVEWLRQEINSPLVSQDEAGCNVQLHTQSTPMEEQDFAVSSHGCRAASGLYAIEGCGPNLIACLAVFLTDALLFSPYRCGSKDTGQLSTVQLHHF